MASDLNNLASLLPETNRLEEAEPMMAAALVNYHASLGNEHSNTQRVMQNYYPLLQPMGLEDEAQAKIQAKLRRDVP